VDGNVIYVHAGSSLEASSIANGWYASKGSQDRPRNVSPVQPGSNQGVNNADVIAQVGPGGNPISVGRVSSAKPLGFFNNSATKSTVQFLNDVFAQALIPPPATPPVGDSGGDFNPLDGGASNVITPPVVNDPTLTDDPLATEEQSMFANFLAGLGARGAGTTGIAGRARVNQFQPLQAQFLANQVLNPGAEGTLQQTFKDFIGGTPLSGSASNANASNLFNQALSRSSGLNPAGGGFEGLTEKEQGFLNPSDSRQASALEGLARSKARGQFGVASEFFRPNVGLFDQFQGQGQSSASSFADFLNKKIFGG
jgi:hypothetical protein